LQAHFSQAQRALDAGVPLRGFFVWSLMDNFEWAMGYALRYGICYTDYATQQRIPKASAHWYREFIRGQAG
jgi:beta-glucosidase